MGAPAPMGVAASGVSPLAGDQANAVVQGLVTGIGPTPPFAIRGPMNLLIWGSANTALTVTAGSFSATVASGTGLAVGNAINSTLVPLGTTIGVIAGTAVTLAPPPRTLYGRLDATGQISLMHYNAGLLGTTALSPYLAANTTVKAILIPAIPSNNVASTLGAIMLSAPPSVSTYSTMNRLPFVFVDTTGASILASGTDAAATFTGTAIGYTGSVQLERSFDGGATWIVCNLGSAGTMAVWSAGTPVSTTFGEPEREVFYRLNCTAYTAANALNYRISTTGVAAEALAVNQLT